MKESFIYKRYCLRKAQQKDIQGFLDISADWNVMQYYGQTGGDCKTREEAQTQITWCNKEFTRNAGRWIIAEIESDEYIGDIGFSGFVEKHRRAEIGYRLMKSYWGSGIVSAFIGQLIDWGFRDLNYNRIEALVDTRNEGSKKVLTKNGFSYEGTLRDYEYEHSGFVDLEMYSILKKEYS